MTADASLTDYEALATPVSYTHLDVYKRQGWYNSRTRCDYWEFSLLAIRPAFALWANRKTPRLVCKVCDIAVIAILLISLSMHPLVFSGHN